MNARGVIGRRIVKVSQSWVRTNAGSYRCVESILLDNGVRLIPTADETEDDGPVADLMVVRPDKAT